MTEVEAREGVPHTRLPRRTLDVAVQHHVEVLLGEHEPPKQPCRLLYTSVGHVGTPPSAPTDWATVREERKGTDSVLTRSSINEGWKEGPECTTPRRP